MSAVVIGMDPHKRTATIEIMASDEAVVGGGRYATDAAGYRSMLAAAKRGQNGSGQSKAARALAGISLAGCWLTASGWSMCRPSCPPASGCSLRPGRKTGATGAHSVALAAARMAGLRPLIADQQLMVLRILADRRRSLGEDHIRMICQLHQLLWELIPRGRQEEPVRGPGQGAARQGRPARYGRPGAPAGSSRADRRPQAHLPAHQGRRQGTYCATAGHRNDADQPAWDRPVRRCPAADRGRRHHPVPDPGAFRLLERHRADRCFLR